jgi:hypothetical protein
MFCKGIVIEDEYREPAISSITRLEFESMFGIIDPELISDVTSF